MAFEGLDPAAGRPASLDAPMWFSGGGGGLSPYLGSSTGTNGTSLVAPLGSSERNNNGGGSKGEGSNGSGSNGGGSNGGGSNGGGSNGGGSNGGGSNGGGSGDGGSGGGGEQPPFFVPPTTTGEVPFTTTGSTETTTTGNHGERDDRRRDTHTVPEPGTLVLLGLGACGLAARALRARRR